MKGIDEISFDTTTTSFTVRGKTHYVARGTVDALAIPRVQTLHNDLKRVSGFYTFGAEQTHVAIWRESWTGDDGQTHELYSLTKPGIGIECDNLMWMDSAQCRVAINVMSAQYLDVVTALAEATCHVDHFLANPWMGVEMGRGQVRTADCIAKSIYRKCGDFVVANVSVIVKIETKGGTSALKSKRARRRYTRAQLEAMTATEVPFAELEAQHA